MNKQTHRAVPELGVTLGSPLHGIAGRPRLHVPDLNHPLSNPQAGVPQLVAPIHFDQDDWAWCVERHGIGKHLGPLQVLLRFNAGVKLLKAKHLADEIERVLCDVAVAERCKRMARALCRETCGIVRAQQHVQSVLGRNGMTWDRP